jgi:hypothetical protein
MSTFYRTLVLPPAGTNGITSLGFPNKTPASVLDFWIDLSNRLPWLIGSETLDTVASFTVTSFPTGLEITPLALASPVVGVMIADGAANQLYDISFTVTTAGGYVIEIDIYLLVMVESLATTSPPVAIVTGPTGAPGTPGAPPFIIATEPPSPSLGIAGDSAICTLTGNVWLNVAGTWVNEGHLGPVTGTLVQTVVTTSLTASAVSGLPVIPAGGGYCWLQGTLVAQDQVTRDIAVWNVALVVIRAPEATYCSVIGDATPSLFTATGTLEALAAPALSASTTGPTIFLPGLLSDHVTWGVNLNITTGN